MSEFKGTPSPWVIDFGGSKGHIKSTAFLKDGTERTPTVARYDIFSDFFPERFTEEKANALLISKAPEMLGEINESIKDLLCMQVSINEAMKTDSKWEGMYELLQKQIDRKKQLIKSATQI